MRQERRDGAAGRRRCARPASRNVGASQGFYSQTVLHEVSPMLAGGYISTSMPPLDLAPDIIAQLSDFQSRYPVTSLSAFGYASAQIIMSAVRRTGATNRLTAMTLAAIGFIIQYAGRCPFQFAPTGDPIDPIRIFLLDRRREVQVHRAVARHAVRSLR